MESKMKNGIVMVVLCLATLQMVSAQEPQTEVATDTATKTIELNEVVVKSLLPKTRVSGDAMRTFIVGSSLETAGTATDLLGKLPMLKAEKGEGVEVFGRGQAEVYINGRKVQDMNELDRLRSEDILHVDVITSPGARYAATTKAVVRITTKKKQGDGWSFVEELSGYYQYGLSGANNLTVNFRTGNLDITGSLWCSSYGHSRGNSPSNLFYLVGDDVYVGRSTQDIKNRWNCYAPQLQFNYMINENHSFGAYYKWDYSPKDLRNGWFLMNNEKNGVLAESMLSDIVKESNYSNHLFNAYYNGKVRQLSIDWNIDGLFGKELEKSTTVETVTYYEDVLQQKNEVHNQTNYRNSFLATKLVLSYPVWKGSLSAGAEYSYTSREDVYNVLSVEQLPVAGSDTEISESSVAAFAEYGRSFGGFYAQIGLRYEHLKNEYSDFGVRQDEVCRSYGDWFPSVTLAYPMSKGPQLSLSYRKDIQRPNYYTLSSSILYINKYSYQSGNPYLTPIYTHNLTFNAAYRWANLTFVYERIIDDIVLQSMPYPGSNDPMVTLISSVNCPDDYNRFTINMSARPVIGVWHPMWNVALFLQNYKTETIDGSTITMNHPYLQIQWINDFLFPHDWRLDSRIVFASKGDYMSYRMTKNIWDTSLGLQKDINTKRVGKFTFDLRCYDPFNLQKSGVLVFGPRNFETINPARRLFSFDVTWRFNEADKKYRGTGAGQSQKSRL